jgi:YggT family protein
MSAFAFLISAIASLIWWVVIVQVILSWLISFNIVNTNNPFVYRLYYSLEKILEPLLRPIRNFLPNLGGIDLSPIILLIGVGFVERLLISSILPAIFL